MIAFFKLIRAASDSRDAALCAAVVEAYVNERVAVVPTLVNGRADGSEELLADESVMKLLPKAVRDQWELMARRGDPFAAVLGPTYSNTVENVRMLARAGVPVLAGTDVGNPFLVPGISLHDELALLVEDVGLSPLEALQAATIRPAHVFGLADTLGTTPAVKVAVLHHHLHPHPESATGKRGKEAIWQDLSTIRDAGLVERQFERLGFDIVLHGHKHQHMLRETLVKDGVEADQQFKRLIVCGAGSVAVDESELPRGTENQYQVITLLSPQRRP